MMFMGILTAFENQADERLKLGVCVARIKYMVRCLYHVRLILSSTNMDLPMILFEALPELSSVMQQQQSWVDYQ